MSYSLNNILPGSFSAVDTSRKFNLGAVAFDADGNGYRYVQVDVSGTADWAAGKPVGLISGGTPYECAADLPTGVNCCGIAQATIDVSAYTDGTDTLYTWIQVSGSAAVTLHTGTDVTHGLHVVWHADGTVDLLAAGEEHQSMGFCIGGSGTTSLTIQLQGML
tara:strand:+ start:157 stop:645 length:489 start_codon:yes stop_codon:yes gene_type:complete